IISVLRGVFVTNSSSSENELLTLTDKDILSLAKNILYGLRTRRHTKHPHIGLLGPNRRENKNLISRLSRNIVFVAEKEEEELLSEETLEEKAYWSSQRIIPHILGFEGLKLEKAAPHRELRLFYRFFIRTAPPTIKPAKEVIERQQFRLVTVSVKIEDEKEATVCLDIFDGEEKPLYHEEEKRSLRSGSLKIEIPCKDFKSALKYLSTENLPFIIGAGLLADGEERRLPFQKQPTSPSYAFIHCLRVRVEMRNSSKVVVFGSALENIGGWIAHRSNLSMPATHGGKGLYNPKFVIYDANDDTWSVGHLLEVRAEIGLLGYRHKISWMHKINDRKVAGLTGIYPINSLVSLLQSDLIVLEDSVADEEVVYGVKKSQRSVEEALHDIIEQHKEALGILNVEALSDAFAEALQGLGRGRLSNLYTFQEKSCISILRALVKGTKRCIALTARTAGGKTLAFLLPILIYSTAFKLRDPRPGVKSLLFYPTKALCHDQADVIIKMLWHLNQRLGVDKPLLTFGILHGDTYNREREVENTMIGASVSRDLRFKCPECGRRLMLLLTLTDTGAIQEEVCCSNSQCMLGINGDKKKRRFLGSMIRATRQSIYSQPPDILVTTPDMLNVRMFYDPSEQTIFGRSVRVCRNCGWRTTSPTKRKCDGCEANLKVNSVTLAPTYPRIFVFDEAHQLRGSFGAQVSYIISRLETLIKTVNGLQEYNPLYILSSATFSNPTKFASKFLGLPESQIQVISAELSERETPAIRKVHLFILPKGYSPQATLARIAETIFKYCAEVKGGTPPHILVFVNRIAEANMLIGEARVRLLVPEIAERMREIPSIDGHSTDYSRRRAEVEDKFSRGEIHLLVATRGLEVGVDFDIIDGLIIFGAPFYLSDFVQRTGRAGRSREALIITVFSDKPCDFDFHRNYKTLTDMKLREAALRAEQIPLKTDNPVIFERSITRAVLDYLCTRKNAYEY
ncbi:MAG: hypothetical protein DRO12_06540, partial [Thermoprotei archaeon]